MKTTPIAPRLYLQVDGSVTGPHAASDLLAQLNKGRCSPAVPAMIEGHEGWGTLGEALRHIFPPRAASAPVKAGGFSLVSRIADAVGNVSLMLVGGAMAVVGIPLLRALVGFILIPLGLVIFALGFAGLLRGK